MYNKIKNIFSLEDKKKLLSNFLSLSILQGVNYVLPLITLPYLVRVLSTEKFGLIMFAQAFIQYFVILTDYGFNLSATREISIHRENKEKISEIFNAVMIIKFGLLILSFIIMSIIVFSFEKFRKDWLIYYLTFGVVIGQVLFPVWFFQGIEKMKYITFLNILAKLIFTIAIFVFIHKADDYIYVPLINSLGFLVAGVLAIFIVFNKFRLVLLKPSSELIKKFFGESTNLFLSNLSVSLYTATNTLILGLFASNTLVGIYSSMEKLVFAIKNLYIPIYQTLFPWLSKKSRWEIYKLINKIIPFFLLVGFFWFLVIFIFAKEILAIVYNNENIIMYFEVFRILSFISIFSALNMLFNMLYFTSIKAYSIRTKILLFGGLYNVFAVYFLTFYFSIYGTALGFTSTELLLLLLGYYYFYKHKQRG